MNSEIYKKIEIKNKYVLWLVIFALSAMLSFLDARYCDSVFSGIILPIGGIFLGPAAVAGFVAGCCIANLLPFTGTSFVIFMISSFCMSFVPWLLRNYIKDITNPIIILKYYVVILSSVIPSVAAVLIYLFLNSSNESVIYSISIGSEILCTGYAVGFPIYYFIRYFTDKSLGVKHKGVCAFCIWMPIQLAVSVWFALKAVSVTSFSSFYDKWLIINIVLAIFFGIMALIVWAFCKRKRTMLNVFTLIIGAFTIYNFVSFDLGIGTYILTIIAVWLAVHAIFFKLYEDKYSSSKALRTVSGIAHIILAFIFTVVVALSSAPYAIPAANGNESGMIILGAPVNDNKASEILMDRIICAADFLDKSDKMPVIATGGTKVVGGKTEAQIITEELEKRGVSPNLIIQEAEAKTTEENFSNCRKIIVDLGGDTNDEIIITTSEFHLLRAAIFARNAGFTNITCLGAPSYTAKSLTWYIREAFTILPMLL